MRTTRIYIDSPLEIGRHVILSRAAVNHLVNVLRLSHQASLIVFNGKGVDYLATLDMTDRRQVGLHILAEQDNASEPRLEITLVQGISKGERMDFAIQKAVELGVSHIVPVITQHCALKIPSDRFEKKWQHWHNIAISACEQSGRTSLPTLSCVVTLDEYFNALSDAALMRFVLSPKASDSFKAFEAHSLKQLVLLVGPEGGLSDLEYQHAAERHFNAVTLGPRILRTETAALAAISVVQSLWGDF